MGIDMSNVVQLFPLEQNLEELNHSIQTLNDQLLDIKTVTSELEFAGFEPYEVRQRQAELLKAMSSRVMWFSHGLQQQVRFL